MWTFLQILMILTVLGIVIWLAYSFLVLIALTIFDGIVWTVNKVTILLKGIKKS